MKLKKLSQTRKIRKILCFWQEEHICRWPNAQISECDAVDGTKIYFIKVKKAKLSKIQIKLELSVSDGSFFVRRLLTIYVYCGIIINKL